MPGNDRHPDVAAQDRDNAKDDKWPIWRADGILNTSHAEDQEEHAGSTNTGREVKGERDVPSEVGMDVKDHGSSGGVNLPVCLRTISAATDKLRAAFAAAINAAR